MSFPAPLPSSWEEWPKPTDRKVLQHFLGFANFYHRFIHNYSTIAAPLTHLTTTKDRFAWDKEAEKSFVDLKRFTSAPILVHPDTKAQFIVEVDASNVGVGAILSQCSAGDFKVHPCAFYSHRLSPAEQNYDIGNKELLAIKLVLEEWQQWLEGAQVPFQVWTDHKNLEYSKLPRGLTLTRLDGHYFSHASTSILPIGLELRMSIFRESNQGD